MTIERNATDRKLTDEEYRLVEEIVFIRLRGPQPENYEARCASVADWIISAVKLVMENPRSEILRQIEMVRR